VLSCAVTAVLLLLIFILAGFIFWLNFGRL